jgi:hypothetical protein
MIKRPSSSTFRAGHLPDGRRETLAGSAAMERPGFPISWASIRLEDYFQRSSPRIWLDTANEAFGGHSALEIMLHGELTDLMRVRNYLDAERGGR